MDESTPPFLYVILARAKLNLSYQAHRDCFSS
jgi:hypothetical protein